MVCCTLHLPTRRSGQNLSDITNYKALLGKFTASEASLLLRDGTTVTTTFATALRQLKHGTCVRVKFK
jgi:hypothetical protein